MQWQRITADKQGEEAESDIWFLPALPDSSLHLVLGTERKRSAGTWNVAKMVVGQILMAKTDRWHLDFGVYYLLSQCHHQTR